MYRRRSRQRASLNPEDHRWPPCHGDRSVPPAATRHHRKPYTEPTIGSISSSTILIATCILVCPSVRTGRCVALGGAVLLFGRAALFAEVVVPPARRRRRV